MSKLSHLARLEAESIHILREVVAECERPVMLYSIGKDSSVMLHLAFKAFYPGRLPFPLLHVDTTWKFREMIAFRDATVQRMGLDLIIHTNQEGLAQGINPFTHGAAVHTDIMKTQALKQALDLHGFDAAFGGARRGEVAGQGAGRVDPFGTAPLGPQATASGTLAPLQYAQGQGREPEGFSALELDRARYLAVHPPGTHSDRAAVLRGRAPGRRTRRDADHGRRRAHAARTRRAPAAAPGALPHARLLPAHRCDPQRGRHADPDHRGDALGPHLRAPGPCHRPRCGGLDGAEEAGRLFLMNAEVSSRGALELWLESQARKDLLRFITCGSVDDGKSTLIGRLLFESRMLFDDQLAALESDSKKLGTQGDALDFALLVDGLAAEREQGITIDVAYRFFTTERRKFIVADTPGHEQYTRNMVTGASTADLAVILIDARKGVLTQTRRHSYLVSLLGIKQVVVAVNKLDLVDYAAPVFEEVERVYREFAARIALTDIVAIPLSA